MQSILKFKKNCPKGRIKQKRQQIFFYVGTEQPHINPGNEHCYFYYDGSGYINRPYTLQYSQIITKENFENGSMANFIDDIDSTAFDEDYKEENFVYSLKPIDNHNGKEIDDSEEEISGGEEMIRNQSQISDEHNKSDEIDEEEKSNRIQEESNIIESFTKVEKIAKAKARAKIKNENKITEMFKFFKNEGMYDQLKIINLKLNNKS